MATLLADPPAAAPSERQPAPGSSGAGEPQAPAPDASPPAQRMCANCGAAMDGTQDWCLHCGAGARDSLSTRSPSWRSAAAILGVVAILVAGAATAAYAALSKDDGKTRSRTVAVAQVPAPTTSTSVVPTTPPVSATPTPTIGTPTTIKPALPLIAAKPPKIPLSAPTPLPTGTGSPKVSPTTSIPAATPTTGGANSTGETQEAILLDTNAAATYNPYAYPASDFGDPSLAIDGDTSTAWTAQVNPAVAPKMAEGLVIDLNTAQKLSALALTSSTPGMTVQVYGANGHNLPASITDSAWVALSPSLLAKKKHVRIKFGGSTIASKQAAKKAYRFVALWISGAPAASVGTAQAPGHVSVNELELFPPKK